MSTETMALAVEFLTALFLCAAFMRIITAVERIGPGLFDRFIGATVEAITRPCALEAQLEAEREARIAERAAWEKEREFYQDAAEVHQKRAEKFEEAVLSQLRVAAKPGDSAAPVISVAEIVAELESLHRFGPAEDFLAKWRAPFLDLLGLPIAPGNTRAPKGEPEAALGKPEPLGREEVIRALEAIDRNFSAIASWIRGGDDEPALEPCRPGIASLPRDSAVQGLEDACIGDVLP